MNPVSCSVTVWFRHNYVCDLHNILPLLTMLIKLLVSTQGVISTNQCVHFFYPWHSAVFSCFGAFVNTVTKSSYVYF